MREPSRRETFAGIVTISDLIEAPKRCWYLVIQWIVVKQMRQLKHITYHQLTTNKVNHGVVVNGDEQNVVVQEQTELTKIKVQILYVVVTTQPDDIRLVCSVSVLHKQQILDMSRIQ